VKPILAVHRRPKTSQLQVLEGTASELDVVAEYFRRPHTLCCCLGDEDLLKMLHTGEAGYLPLRSVSQLTHLYNRIEAYPIFIYELYFMPPLLTVNGGCIMYSGMSSVRPSVQCLSVR